MTGRPPFWGRHNKEIIRKVIRGHVKFPSTIRLSETCKDFILCLLQKEPGDRLDAAQALQHPWITGESQNIDFGEEVLSNLATFGTANKLKQLIVKTVAENLDKKHRQEYEQQFKALDLANDNLIDKSELTQFIIKCGIDQEIAEDRANKLLVNVAGIGQKGITLEDWNHANVARLLSSDHLIERQYQKLDVDEDGFISAEDLLSIFEGAEDQHIAEIIDEVDTDQDGNIKYATIFFFFLCVCVRVFLCFFYVRVFL